MSFLVVAGVTVSVTATDNTNIKKAIVRIGSTTRAFSGLMRTTVRAEKRMWQFTTKWLADSDAATIETAIANGAHVTCSGDALGGVSVTCQVTSGDGYIQFVQGGFKRQLVLTLEEV